MKEIGSIDPLCTQNDLVVNKPIFGDQSTTPVTLTALTSQDIRLCGPQK